MAVVFACYWLLADGKDGGMHLLREYDDWLTSWDLAVTGGWAGPDNSDLLLYDRAAEVSDH